MSPGESNGGNGTLPTTKVGVTDSTLNAAQKQLVLEAMKRLDRVRVSNGVAFRSQVHYHTLWRDHLRDYGKT